MGFYDRPGNHQDDTSWILVLLMFVWIIGDGVVRPRNKWTRAVNFLLTLALGVGLTLAYQHFFGAPPQKVKP
jgi:hypothetical protein